jgi:hypothetical protein
MEQLGLFDFPDRPVRPRMLSDTTLKEKWDGWWLALLRRQRTEWEDSEEFDLPDTYLSRPKQEAIPGLD